MKLDISDVFVVVTPEHEEEEFEGDGLSVKEKLRQAGKAAAAETVGEVQATLWNIKNTQNAA